MLLGTSNCLICKQTPCAGPLVQGHVPGWDECSIRITQIALFCLYIVLSWNTYRPIGILWLHSQKKLVLLFIFNFCSVALLFLYTHPCLMILWSGVFCDPLGQVETTPYLLPVGGSPDLWCYKRTQGIGERKEGISYWKDSSPKGARVGVLIELAWGIQVLIRQQESNELRMLRLSSKS